MITMKDFLDCIQYKITGGDQFMWDCYGVNSRILNSYSSGIYDASVVFDAKTQVVYEVTVCDYAKSIAYRLTHPDYVEKRKEEAKERDVDNDQAWDDVSYIDLETDEDFIEKATAIVAGQDYDDRIVLPIDIDTEHLFILMKEAHKQDMTLNQYFDQIVREYIEFI